MLLIDFRKSAKKAFTTGVQKGLAAPFLLYGRFHAPEIIHVRLIELPDTSTSEAIKSDWEAIGLDIKKAAELYGKTTA